MQWQNQGQLPYGFANSNESFSHWDQGDDLGWALYCWGKGPHHSMAEKVQE